MYTSPLFKIALWVVMETMQLHIIKMDLLLRNISCLPLSGPTNHLIDISNKCSYEFNVGLILLGLLNYAMVLPNFFKFSLIFMNMQMR